MTLESVKDLVNEIIVVDSGSTDGTLEIVKEYTDKIFYKEWKGFGPQKKFAEQKCQNEWILNLDADEALLGRVKDSIRAVFRKPGSERSDMYSLQICHVSHLSKNYKPLPFAPKNVTPRLYNKNKAGFKVSAVHDKVVSFNNSKSIVLDGKVSHVSLQSFQHMWSKIEHYSELQAEAWLERDRPLHYIQLLYDPIIFFIKYYFIRRFCFVGIEGLVFSLALSAGRALRIGMAIEKKLERS